MVAEEPAFRNRNEAPEAIQALQDLQAANRAGLNYDEYSRRVVDTKIKVDRYLRGVSSRSTDIYGKVSDAMGFYEYARLVWAAKIRYTAASNWEEMQQVTQNHVIPLLHHPAYPKCTPMVERLRAIPREGTQRDKSYDD